MKWESSSQGLNLTVYISELLFTKCDSLIRMWTLPATADLQTFIDCFTLQHSLFYFILHLGFLAPIWINSFAF